MKTKTTQSTEIARQAFSPAYKYGPCKGLPRPMRLAAEVVFRGSALALAACAVFGFNPRALAANETWASTGGTNAWSSTTNWGGNTAPGATAGTTNTDVAIFNSAVGAVGVTGNPIFIDQAGQNIGGIDFTGSAGNFFIGRSGTASVNSLLLTSGGEIQIDSGLTSVAAAETIQVPLVIEGGNGTYTIANNSLSGTGTGAGTLTLSGSLSGGAAGATVLTLSGSNTNANTISGVIANGTAFTGSATSLGITKLGTGAWHLSGANTFSGPVTIGGGELEFNNEASLYTDGTSSWNAAHITVQSGATLAIVITATNAGLFSPNDINALISGIDAGSSASAGFETGSILGLDTGATALTYGNVIPNGYAGGTMGLTKLGTAQLTLTASNTYTGATTISVGTLEFANEASFYNDVTSNWTGTQLTVATGAVLALQVGSSPQFTNADIATLLTNMATTSSSTSGFETGSTLGLDTGTNVVNAFTETNAIANPYLSGTLGLRQMGVAPLTLSGANTYTGATTVTTGTLLAGIASVPNVSGAFGDNSNLTVNNTVGSAVNLNGFNTQIGFLAGGGTAGGGVILGSNTLTIGGTGTGNATYGGTLSGAGGGITMSGAGTQFLSGSNNYTGLTTVTSGILQFTTETSLYADNTASWTGTDVIVGNGGTLSLSLGNGPQFTSANLGTLLSNMDATSSGTSGFEAGSRLGLDTTSAEGFEWSSSIVNPYVGGSLGLTKLGPGILYLMGSNSYTGPTTISNGTIEFGSENSLYGNSTASWTGTSIIVGSGGTLALALGSASPQFTAGDLGTLLANMDTSSSGTSGFEPFSSLGLDTTGVGTFTYSNVIADAFLSGSTGLMKLGTGTLNLNGSAVNTYTGPTTVSAGTLAENFNNLATPTNLINSASTLTLAGGTLTLGGTAHGAPTQTFAGLTLSAGNSVLTGSGDATVNLGAITYTVGSDLVLNGPTYNNAPTTASGQAGTGLVAATGTFTTTTGANNAGLVSTTAGVADHNQYATVGLYDYAITTGTGTLDITGASQGTGGSPGDGAYTLETATVAAGTAFADVEAGDTASAHSTTSYGGVRFNAAGAAGLTVNGNVVSIEALLVTPNVGAANITLSLTGAGALEPGQRDANNSSSISIFQNNTSGYMIVTGSGFFDGRPAGSSIIQTGSGTVDYTGSNNYTGQTYLNGGVTEIVAASGLGFSSAAAAANLDGGTVLGDATFSMDNGGGALPRTFFVDSNGGGLAAVTGFTMTIDGTIGGGPSGSGPLVIGIPAQGANGNTVGLVPGTGAGTANTTSLFGDGTVALTGSNYYFGGTTLVSGTLNINGINALGGAAYGGVTFNGGALQYASGFSGNGSGDLTSIGTAGITIAGGATIDTNGNAVTYAGSIGNGGTGSLTVMSSAAGGSLTMNGNTTFTGALTVNSGKLTLKGSNVYTGATVVNSGTLALTGGASLANTSITVAGGGALTLQGNSLGTAGAKITLQANSTLSLQDNAIDTVTLNSTAASGTGTVFTVGGAAPANLDFDLNSGTSDELVINQGETSFGAEGGKIFVDDLDNNTPLLSYTLISDPSGGLANGASLGSYFTLGNSTLTANGITYALSLATSSTTSITLSLTSDAVNYFWTGNSSSSWSSINNFATTHTGSVSQSGNLGSTSNVFLTADSPTLGNLASQTLDGNYTINSLTFTGNGTGAGSTGITLGSGTGTALTLSAANQFADPTASGTTNYAAGIGLVVQPGSAAHTISANINLGNSQTWQISNSSTNPLTVSGVIADAPSTLLDALTLTGSGALVLTNTNTYDGGTTVTGGTLMLGTGGALASTGALTVNGTGTFDLGGNTQTIGGLSDGGVSTGTITASTGSSTLIVNNSTQSTFSGTITDNSSNNLAASLALDLVGSANVTLSGSNSFTNGTTLTGASLTVSNNYALGSATSSNLGAGLSIPNVSGTSNAFFTSANPNIASLSGSAGARVILGSTSGTGSSTTLNVGTGGTALYGGGVIFAGVISDQSGTKAGAIGSLTVDGGGTLALAGANTFTGVTTITGSSVINGNSELLLQNSLALQDSTLNYNNTGGILNFGSLTAVTLAGLTGSENLALSNASVAAVALTIGNNNVTSVYTGNLGGAGSLTKNGSGSFTTGSGGLGGATYPGATTINQGTFIVGGNSDLTGGVTLTGANGTDNLTVQDNAVVSSTATMIIDSNTANPGAGTVIVTGTGTLAVGNFEVGNITRVPSGNVVTVSGSGTFSDSGFFNFQISEGSTVGGTALNLNGGTVAIGHFLLTGDGGAGSASTLNFAGGTLEALASDPAGSQFLPALALLTANVDGAGAIINTNGFTDTIAQPLVSGTALDGGLTKTGSGTLILTATNTYVGPTRINGGYLVLGATSAAGNTSGLTFGGGSLQYSSSNTADYSTKIVNSTSAVSIDVNGLPIVYSGPINSTNTGGLSVLNAVPGSGSLTLDASNTYSGGTTVNPGAELILGSGGSLPDGTININGTLETAAGNLGIGTGSTNMTLGAGSVLSLMDGTIGSLTINGNLTIGGTSAASIDYELNNTTNDSITVTGGALGFGAGGGVINLTNIGGSSPASGTQYILLTDANGLGADDFTLGESTLFIGGHSYLLSLSTADLNTEEIVTVSVASLDYYWTGNHSASWSNIQNFATDHTGGVARSSTDSLSSVSNVFLTADSASQFTQTLDGNYTINSLSFTGTGTSAGSNPITINPGTLTPAATLTISAANQFTDTGSNSYAVGTGVVVQPGAATDTINVNIDLASSQTWDVNNSASNPLTVTGVIADAVPSSNISLTKTGTGTLILSGQEETYDGNTTVNAGSLILAGGAGLASTGTLAVNGSGLFDLGGSPQTFAGLSGTSSSAIVTNNGVGNVVLSIANTSPSSYAGALNDGTGGLGLIADGSSTLTLSGSSTFSYGTTVESGNLTVANNYGLGNPNSLIATAGLTLNPSLSGTVNVSFTSANPNIAGLNNPGLGVSNVILGSAGASGTNATTLNVNTAVGGYIPGDVFTGTISDLHSTAAAAVGSLVVYGGGSLTLEGTDTFTGTTSITGGGTELIVTNPLALENSTLNYNNQGGTLVVLTGTSATSATLSLGGLTGSENLALLTGSGTPLTLTINDTSSPAPYTGALSGSGSSLVKTGTGTETLAGINSYTGTTTASSGTLTFTNTLGSSGTPTGAITEGAAGAMDFVGASVYSSSITQNGGASIVISGSSNVTSTGNLGANANNANANGEIAITSGTVTANTASVGRDSTTLGTTLPVAGSTTTGMYVNGGTLNIASTLSVGGTTSVENSSAEMRVDAGSVTVGGIATVTNDAGARFSVLDLNGGTFTDNDTSGTGILVGGGADAALDAELLIRGTAVVNTPAITVGNTVDTGGTDALTIDGGTTNIGSGGILTTATAGRVEVFIGSSAVATAPVLTATASWTSSLNMTLANSGTAGGVVAPTFNTSPDGVANSIALSGALSGTAGGLTVTGSGSMTLSGSDSYAGVTTVSGADLMISGSLTGTVSLTATAGGEVDLQSNDAIPSNAHVTLANATLTTLADQTEALSSLTIASGSSTLDLGSSSSVVNFADSSADSWTGTLTINNWNGASAGGGTDEIFVGTTADLTQGQLADITFINGTLDGVPFTTDSAVQLPDGELVAAIPEPGTWAEILAGVGVLCIWQRSRRRARSQA